MHLLGLAYKPGVNDARESPAMTAAACLLASGAVLSYTDSHLPSVLIDGSEFTSLPLEDVVLEEIDIAVVLTAHRGVDYAAVLRRVARTFDATGHLRGYVEAIRTDRLILL